MTTGTGSQPASSDPQAHWDAKDLKRARWGLLFLAVPVAIALGTTAVAAFGLTSMPWRVAFEPIGTAYAPFAEWLVNALNRAGWVRSGGLLIPTKEVYDAHISLAVGLVPRGFAIVGIAMCWGLVRGTRIATLLAWLIPFGAGVDALNWIAQSVSSYQRPIFGDDPFFWYSVSAAAVTTVLYVAVLLLLARGMRQAFAAAGDHQAARRWRSMRWACLVGYGLLPAAAAGRGLSNIIYVTDTYELYERFVVFGFATEVPSGIYLAVTSFSRSALFNVLLVTFAVLALAALLVEVRALIAANRGLKELPVRPSPAPPPTDWPPAAEEDPRRQDPGPSDAPW